MPEPMPNLPELLSALQANADATEIIRAFSSNRGVELVRQELRDVVAVWEIPPAEVV
jgi:hypothetical protein